jgi:hypothetical protein
VDGLLADWSATARGREEAAREEIRQSEVRCASLQLLREREAIAKDDVISQLR